MKKIIVVLLMLSVAIISGCLTEEQLKRAEDTVKVDFDDSKITDKQEITKPEEPITNIYKAGDILTVGDKKVTIKNINIDSEIEIEVDGLTKYIDGTKQPIRIGDYELMSTEINIDYNNPSTITLESNKIELATNEYLFWFKEDKNIANKEVTLEDVFKDSHKTIQVTVSDKSKSDTQKIHQGDTVVINKLAITNVKNGHRATSSEKYAVIKVKETV